MQLRSEYAFKTSIFIYKNKIVFLTTLVALMSVRNLFWYAEETLI